MPAKSPSFLELAHLVISLLCGNKPVSYSYKLVYQSTLLVGTMGDSRLGNQLADDSHREKHQILINHKLKRKNSMEERKLNEKESLELIAQMIQNTKNRLETNCGMPFLFWGYTTIFVSLLVWFLVVTTRNYYWQYLWFLLPIIAGTGTYLSTRNQQPGIKTHLDKVINYIWLVFGITGFLISMLAMFFWQLPILFMVLLLMGMGTTLTGLVIGYKTVTICGTLGALSSIGCLFYPGLNQILIFAPVFIFMMVIPGHVLNHAARKQKNRNFAPMFKELNPLLHSELRLAVMSILVSVEEAEFSYLKQQTGATAGNLSVQIDKLNKADYVEVIKTFKGKMPCTICKITQKGLEAFEEYVDALKKLYKHKYITDHIIICSIHKPV